MLCDDLEGWDGVSGWEGGSTERGMCIHMADVLCYITETNITL